MSIVKVLITGEIHKDALQEFKDLKNHFKFEVDFEPKITRARLIKNIEQYQCIMIRTSTQVDAEFLNHAKNLKLICRIGVGVDNIDITSASAKNIRVANSPSGNRISTAEHTMGFIFSLAKNIPRAHQDLKSGEWNRAISGVGLGMEISGKVLGIIGLGNIGREVARRAQALGMQVIACDPFIDQAVASNLGVKLFGQNELLMRADFVSLHVPLTPQTRGLASDDFFASMKPGAFFINTSRGPVVDEGALEAALNGEQGAGLSGAALDVFVSEPLADDHPFTKNLKMILTPHIAGQTREAALKMSMEAAHTVIEFFETGRLANALN